jgi:hypothetical protein
MNKEFIPYELALELKELGFNEPCFAYYNIDPYLKSPAFNLVKPFDHEWCLPAPLFQQAFRWFREKHNLFGQVNIHTYFIYNISNGDFKIVKKYDKLFETYEEAELECLKKLIEIVKGGNK